MKKLYKKYIGVLFTFIMCISLFGCSFGFNASSYVKICLDAAFKGEVTEFAKIANMSEEDATAFYDNIIESELSSLDSYNISEEKKEKFRALYKDIFNNFQYEVGEAVKNDDGSYTVPVTTQKLIVFDTIIADGQTYIMDYVKSNPSITTDELYDVILDYMYQELSDNLAEARYEDSQVINIQLVKSDDNGYTIQDTDIQNLIASMIDMENAQ